MLNFLNSYMYFSTAMVLPLIGKRGGKMGLAHLPVGWGRAPCIYSLSWLALPPDTCLRSSLAN